MSTVVNTVENTVNTATENTKSNLLNMCDNKIIFNIIDSNCLKLFTLLDNIINNRTLQITQQIHKKLEIINNLRLHNFRLLNYDNDISTNIIIKLSLIINDNTIIETNNNNNNKNIDILLDDIINNCYKYSRCNLLFSNIPEYGLISDNTYIKIDETCIYDTINQFIENVVIQVCQLSCDIYIVKINNDINAKYICNLLTDTCINKTDIFKVTYLEQCNDDDIITNYISDIYNNNKYNIINNDIITQIKDVVNTQIQSPTESVEELVIKHQEDVLYVIRHILQYINNIFYYIAYLVFR